jgi:hypothetical protein
MQNVWLASRMRRLLPKLLLLVSSLTILALILEGTLRIAFYHSRDFSIEMWKYAVQLKLPVSNSDLGFVHAPSRHAFLMGVDVDINSRGLRDREYSDTKSPGATGSLFWVTQPHLAGVFRSRQRCQNCSSIDLANLDLRA